MNLPTNTFYFIIFFFSKYDNDTIQFPTRQNNNEKFNETILSKGKIRKLSPSMCVCVYVCLQVVKERIRKAQPNRNENENEIEIEIK